MKKLFAFLVIAVLMGFSISNTQAQEENTEAATENVEAAVDTAAVEEAPAAVAPEEEVEVKGFHQVLKEKFIEGSPGFMAIVLLALVLGLALAIERIIYLNLATTNTQKLLLEVEAALEKKGIDGAKEVCKNTPGPVASIFYQGLDRHNEGLDVIEKSIISYGSVVMGRLEKNVSWISLFIALAPMLGFMGTVIGMIGAFDAIEKAGDISPQIVANGIKVALLTTVFGLIVAMILQVFYNYIISKIDSLVNDMEDSSISFMDILVKYNAKNR
ncbi:MAG: MotA/TolQ/ExbB proton channel family protein [Bacteroidales bacterium]